MPIALRHNETIGLNLAVFSGAIEPLELVAFGRYHDANRVYAASDAIHLVAADAFFVDLSTQLLDAMRERMHALFSDLGLACARRSAWVCLSRPALESVRYWQAGAAEGFANRVAMFDTLAEACAWLKLDAGQSAAVASGAGFSDIATFEARALSVAFHAMR